MAGMQFEYDEKGGTFYYFLLSFVALILIPATYYLWPQDDKGKHKKQQKNECYCEPCRLKGSLLQEKEPWRKLKSRSIKFALILGWIFVAFLAYKTSQVELDFTEFDPFAELGIDREASLSEIKRAYRQLTLIHHPDKGGDEKRFLRISKAHQALTDEESRKNWEEHGNPDGPGVTHFGIALPKWIVEKQNSMWVLAVYALVFMVLLPSVVGTWWYRTIQYSAEQILMDTTQLYYYLFHKTPNMHLKRVIMILGASFEFESGHNQEIVSRSSDNEEIPPLMRELPHLNEKNKERPLCCPYSVKARALVHAHLTRLPLSETLELDKKYVLKKCPYLINEMVSIVAQLVALKHAGRVNMEPKLDTLEHCMKLSQMIVQGLWDSKSPLLQLPHIKEDSLRHFVTKRRNIRNIQQFVSMEEEDRKNLLRNMNEREYKDIMSVCAMMPRVKMDVESEVLDDEDKTITAGSIVTVTVRLHRENLLDLSGKSNQEDFVENGEEELIQEDEEENDNKIEEQKESQKPKVWEKNKKKKGKGPAKKKKPANKVKKTALPITSGRVEEEEEKSTPEPNGRVPKVKSKKVRDENESTDDQSTDASDGEDSDADAEGGGDGDVMEEEEDWVKFQEEAKKENALETKSKETHLVHCPYFPAVKYEWWWLYIADRKTRSLITAPVQVSSLRQHEEVQLKVSAPHKPGTYQYTVILRSDSYVDFDLFRPIKLEVKEARKVESHPQWEEMSEEEEEARGDDVSESDVSSDEDSD